MLSLLSAGHPVAAQDWDKILDLRGIWQFSVGNDLAWADSAFPAADWDSIFVPSTWENEGYPDYDGFAWYRKVFTAPNDLPPSHLYLRLGHIDDIDVVYLNGRRIAHYGQLEPHEMTGYQEDRQYRLLPGDLKPGSRNVLAVQVYDQQLEGGIRRGKIGLYERMDLPLPALSLEGNWHFMKGDNNDTDDIFFPREATTLVRVPGFWEDGLGESYDGVGWYFKEFDISSALAREDLVLALGRIDDLDEVYLNGRRIGRTGNMRKMRINGDEYRRYRYYDVPGSALRTNGVNLLAVRVYDGLGNGGIYDGPVGLMLEDDFREWRRAHRHKNRRSLLDFILDLEW